MLVQFWKCGGEKVNGLDVNGYTIYVDADSIEYIEPNGQKENAKQSVIYLKRSNGEPYRLGVVSGHVMNVAQKINEALERKITLRQDTDDVN